VLIGDVVPGAEGGDWFAQVGKLQELEIDRIDDSIWPAPNRGGNSIRLGVPESCVYSLPGCHWHGQFTAFCNRFFGICCGRAEIPEDRWIKVRLFVHLLL